MAMSQTRRLRGALFLALCVFSLWNFSVSTAFTTTEEGAESPSAGVTFIADHPLLFSFIVMALCGGLCMTENSSTPRQGNAEDRADYSSFLMIQNILCFTSGIVNALCIIDMGMTVSHQSGNTSHTGRLIMNGGAKFGHLLAAFLFGSFWAGFSKSDCEALYQGRYSPNLLASTLAVVAGCMVHYCKEHGGAGNDNTSECLILFAFSQGIQNGITRRCLSLPICTTHFTGYLTDVGTGLGLWARETVNGNNPPTLLKVLLFCGWPPLFRPWWRGGQGTPWSIQHAGCVAGCWTHGSSQCGFGASSEGEEGCLSGSSTFLCKNRRFSQILKAGEAQMDQHNLQPLLDVTTAPFSGRRLLVASLFPL